MLKKFIFASNNNKIKNCLQNEWKKANNIYTVWMRAIVCPVCYFDPLMYWSLFIVNWNKLTQKTFTEQQQKYNKKQHRKHELITVFRNQGVPTAHSAVTNERSIHIFHMQSFNPINVYLIRWKWTTINSLLAYFFSFCNKNKTHLTILLNYWKVLHLDILRF